MESEKQEAEWLMGSVPILTRSQSWFCHSHEEMGRPHSSEPHVPRAQPCSDIPDKLPRMRTLISPSRLPLWTLSSCQGRDTAREP